MMQPTTEVLVWIKRPTKWSRHTSPIVFVCIWRQGAIWRMNYDGGEQRQLTNTPFKETSPCVSPDGRYLFFASARSGSSQVWRMNADGTNQIQMTNGEGGYPRFVSLDQRWVYFESALDQKLWRVPTDGGEEIQVSDERVA